jgi:hypothetical protein
MQAENISKKNINVFAGHKGKQNTGKPAQTGRKQVVQELQDQGQAVYIRTGTLDIKACYHYTF